MKWIFDRTQLEDVKFAVDNMGIKETFRLVHCLPDEVAVPMDDLIDFQHQFSQQYKQAFGCGY